MKLRKRSRNLVVLMILTVGMLSYSALPFLPTQILPTKVSAYGLSPVSEKEGVVYAVTASGQLVNFNYITPSALNSPPVGITGLAAGELVVGIDFRPRTGQLYGVTNQSRVYTIDTTDPMQAAVTLVGAAPFTPGVTGFAYGVDFNPVPDAIRVVTNLDDQNLRVNPNTGVVAGVDTTLAFDSTDTNAGADPNIVGAAYTNSFSGATTATLYGIDSDLDILVRQGGLNGSPSPNLGQLFTVGSLGVDTTEMVGLDIAAPGDIALASLQKPGATTSSLYWVDLPSGKATFISQIGGGEPIRDIAIVTRVETIFALSQGNNLISFNSGTPGTPISSQPVTGIPTGESLVGLDFRPATGELYSLGATGNLYTVNTSTGLATLVSASPVAAAANNLQIGFDFNPAVDLIRAVNGNNDQNLRVNPNNSALAGTDGNLAFATDANEPNAGVDPNVVASAYLNNFAGTTATALYGIDSNLNALVTQGTALGVTPPVSPNTGQLFTVGTLTMGMGGPTLDVDENLGFDIAPDTNAAFVSFTPPGTTSTMLGTINLASGAVTPIGTIAGGEVIRDIAIGVRVEKVYAVTANNMLVSFNSRTPSNSINVVPISGMRPNETIEGIDYRPATGQLYALSNRGTLYTINTIGGYLSPVNDTPLTPPFRGFSLGFDFNPTVDRIRVVSEQEDDLRLNPDTGAIAGTDGALFYGPGDTFEDLDPAVIAAAYTNNFAGVTSTTLFGIDALKNVLVRQGSPGGAPILPNSGQLATVGPLGRAITTANVGFDISDDGNAYASFTPLGAMQSQLFRINLITGVATPVNMANNTIAASGEIVDIAVQTNFTPSAVDAGFRVVNAASLTMGPVAPDSIVTLFGSFQTQGGQISTTLTGPLPTSLGQLSVTVGGVQTSLYFVSNQQINVRVPSNISDGPAIFQVANANGVTRTGMANIMRAAPGLFTVNGNGLGTVSAVTSSDGINYQPVVDASGNEVPVLPIGANGQPTIMAVFGTGFRNAPPSTIMATIQGNPVPLVYAGLAGIDVNKDQANFFIPPSLVGAGQVSLQFTVNGQASNVVTFTIGGTPPAPARATQSVGTQSVGVSQTTNGRKTTTDRLQVMPNAIRRMIWSIRLPSLLPEEESDDRSKSEKRSDPKLK
jgi:trimeric autotransporter adhesin